MNAISAWRSISLMSVARPPAILSRRGSATTALSDRTHRLICGIIRRTALCCEQEGAEGHAVRAGYLYSGMADVARLTEDRGLYEACSRIWYDITRRQMYITGAIGQSAAGESFSFDYDLPNDLVYGETCAAISLAFFAQRMLRLEPRGEYADVLERVLYNGTISGMSLDGTKFFYVNPLEVDPVRCEQNHQSVM